MLRVLSRGRVAFGVRYSRQYLEEQAIDWAAIRREEARKQEEQRVQAVLK